MKEKNVATAKLGADANLTNCWQGAFYFQPKSDGNKLITVSKISCFPVRLVSLVLYNQRQLTVGKVKKSVKSDCCVSCNVYKALVETQAWS